MKNWIAFATLMAAGALCGAQTVTDSAWAEAVRTVELYREGAPLEEPVLTLGARQQLVLAFDMLEAEPRSLGWRLGHCTADWEPDDLQPVEFMTGLAEGYIEGYDFSFTTRTDYVHYHQTLPAAHARLTHSGNYALTVVDEATGDTLLTRRLRVSEEAVGVRASIGRPFDGMDIDRRQELDVTVDEGQGGASPALRPEYLRVHAMQNRRTDNARWLQFSGYDGRSLTYRNRRENVFDGGNTFRFFDMSNLRAPMYNMLGTQEYGGELMAMVRPCEDRSRSHYLNETTLNGGMKVNVWDRTNPAIEAEYVWVTLSLPVGQPTLDGSVYVVGALTDWRMDERSRMEYSPERRAYTKRLLLKQGYYAYLLLVGGPRAVSATSRYEGDHYQTPNEYTVGIYYRSPADRADRLLAVRKVKNEK